MKIRTTAVVTLFVLFLSVLFNGLRAHQILHFDHLTTFNGLSSRHVRSILQDSKGFLWFATRDGLNRYDGYHFKRYTHDPDEINSLADSDIFSIFEDHHGIFWIGTSGEGLLRFDPVTESSTSYRNDPQNPNSLSNNFVTDINQDRLGNLWIGTWGGGLNLFDPMTETFKRYAHDPRDPNSLGSNLVLAIFKDRSGDFWVGLYGDHGGLCQVHQSEDDVLRFTLYRHDPKNPSSISANAVTSIYEDRLGYLWIATDVGLNKFDRDKKSFTRFYRDPNHSNSLIDNSVNALYQDRSGALWVGTDHGLSVLKFNGSKIEFINHLFNPAEANNSGGNFVTDIHEDHSGVIWIATKNGLRKYVTEMQSFAHHANHAQILASVYQKEVHAVYQDEAGILWLGTQNEGLVKFDPGTNELVRYQSKPGNPVGLSHNFVTAICKDRTGMLWIGTWGGGLNRFDPRSGKFNQFKWKRGAANTLGSNHVASLFADDAGAIWIGHGEEGLDKFEYSKNRFTHYQYNPENPNSLSSNHVGPILMDRFQNLWIGTNGGGLNRFDPKQEIFTRYFHDHSDSSTVGSNKILTIHEDSSGNLWIGTKDGGLDRFDYETEKFQRFTRKNGLADNSIKGILEDHDQRLWLSTNLGLARFDVSTGSFKNFSRFDGLKSAEFLPRACYRNVQSNDLYFGSINGLVVVNPDQILDNPHKPLMVFTELETLNPGRNNHSQKVFVNKNIAYRDDVALTHKDNIFTIHYAALHYAFPEKNRYAYRLEGFNNTWHHVQDKRYVTFTHLNPGKYVFRVKGSNHSGIWSEEAAITIILQPPWWLSLWAKIIYAMVLIAGIVAVDQIQRMRLRKKEKEKYERFMASKELELAATIQRRILPETLPNLPNFELAGFNFPSKEIGGDYYECFVLPNHRIAAVVADVSGKGISAALLVNSVHAALHAYMDSSLSLPDLTMKLNDIIFHATTTGMYVTLFIAMIDTRSGEMESVNAGHPPMYLFRQNGELVLLHKGGIPLGWLKGMSYESEKNVIEPGDVLFLFTDGILEAKNKKEQEYADTERFQEVMKKCLQEESCDFQEIILSDVQDYSNSENYVDDITALFVKRKSESIESSSLPR